jgi:hypothetical protein
MHQEFLVFLVFFKNLRNFHEFQEFSRISGIFRNSKFSGILEKISEFLGLFKSCCLIIKSEKVHGDFRLRLNRSAAIFIPGPASSQKQLHE